MDDEIRSKLVDQVRNKFVIKGREIEDFEINQHVEGLVTAKASPVNELNEAVYICWDFPIRGYLEETARENVGKLASEAIKYGVEDLIFEHLATSELEDKQHYRVFKLIEPINAKYAYDFGLRLAASANLTDWNCDIYPIADKSGGQNEPHADTKPLILPLMGEKKRVKGQGYVEQGSLIKVGYGLSRAEVERYHYEEDEKKKEKILSELEEKFVFDFMSDEEALEFLTSVNPEKIYDFDTHEGVYSKLPTRTDSMKKHHVQKTEDPIEDSIVNGVTLFDVDDTIKEAKKLNEKFAKCPRCAPLDAPALSFDKYGREWECRRCSKTYKKRGKGNVIDFVSWRDKITRKKARSQLAVLVKEEDRASYAGAPELTIKYDEEGKPRPAKVVAAEHIIQTMEIVSLRQTGRSYVWDGKHYKHDSDHTSIGEYAASLLRDYYSRAIEADVIRYIIRLTGVEISDFQAEPTLLNLENGILHIETGDLLPHSKDYLFWELIPIDYDANAVAPKWSAFLKSVCISDEDIDTLQEFAGYCLWKGGNPFQKALMLTGNGRNGKSQFLTALQHVLGEENICTVDPDQLEDQVGPKELSDKLANIVPDVNPTPLKKTNIFKKSTSDEYLSVRPLYGKEFVKFKSYAKHMFGCNQAPEPRYDDSDAFYRRWFIIKFPHNFDGEECKYCGNGIVHTQTPNIGMKLYDEEKQGIFNWMLDGLQRILVKDGFSHLLTIAETREKYEESMDSVSAFTKKHLVYVPDSRIPKSEIYGAFMSWAKAEGLPTVADNVFGRRLKRAIPESESGFTLGAVKDRKTAWKNVAWQTDYDDIVKESVQVGLGNPIINDSIPIRTLSQESTGSTKASTISEYDRDDRDVIGIKNKKVHEDNDRDDRDDRVILRSHNEENVENQTNNGGNLSYAIKNESIPINAITPDDIPDEIRKLHPLHPDYESDEEKDDN